MGKTLNHRITIIKMLLVVGEIPRMGFMPFKMGILTQVCILLGNEKKAICTLSLSQSINLYSSYFNFVTKMPKEGEKKYRVTRKDWKKEEWARGWLSASKNLSGKTFRYVCNRDLVARKSELIGHTK